MAACHRASATESRHRDSPWHSGRSMQKANPFIAAWTACRNNHQASEETDMVQLTLAMF